MRVLRWRRWSAAAVALFSVAACGGPSGGTSTSASQDATPIVFATTADTTYAPYYVCVDQGICKKHGVNARYQIFDGTAGLNALIAGDVQIAPTSELPALVNKDKGGAFIGTLITLNAPRQIGIAATSAIKTADDLLGKRIGVPFGSGPEYFLGKYIEFHHLDKSKMKIVNVQPSDMLPAISRGDIDAFSLYEPFISEASTVKSGAHVLTYSGEDGIWIEQYAMNTSTKFANEHPALLRSTISALIETADWIKKNPKQAAAIVAKAIRLSESATEALIGKMSYPMDMTKASIDDFQSAATWLKSQGKINSDPTALTQQLFNSDALKAVDPQRVKL